ncbi:MAG: ABC transporter permease DevC [Prochloraceae cyanobacterium]|nr:ABC transporter permease DevC [Prochloraceae cyanobacterium]
MFKKLFEEVPLAWSQLAHQKIRLLVALSGISFANILIFTQLGFKATLFSGETNIPESMKGDLFLIDNKAQFVGNESISKQQLYRAEGVEGVASAKPVYYSMVSWLNPWNKKNITINVLAFNPAQPVLNLPEINRQIGAIEQPDTVLFDSKSLASLGAVPEAIAEGKTVRTKVNERKIKVGGVFPLGTTAFRRGHIVTSDVNYIRIFGSQSADNIQVGIITLKPGANPQKVIAGLQQTLPDDIKVIDRASFIALEKDYWNKEPAGIIFNFGIIMGFVVGIIIVYQVLYTDVNDHLPEYATLKAMGYSDTSLLMVVFQEATILAVLGFVPGFTFSAGLYGFLGSLTQIAVIMSVDVALTVFLLTLLMCIISAAIAVQKLRSADPADIF